MNFRAKNNLYIYQFSEFQIKILRFWSKSMNNFTVDFHVKSNGFWKWVIIFFTFTFVFAREFSKYYGISWHGMMDYSLYNSTLENCRAATTCYLQSEGPQCEIVCSASAAAQVRPKPSPVPNRVHQKQVGRDTLYTFPLFSKIVTSS